MTEKPPPSFAPLYAGALYPEMAVLFQQHGYALAVHGSLQRDLDLIAIPWVESPSAPEVVLEAIGKEWKIQGVHGPTKKLHGRTAYSVLIAFGSFFVDLSFMPILQEDKKNTLQLRSNYAPNDANTP